MTIFIKWKITSLRFCKDLNICTTNATLSTPTSNRRIYYCVQTTRMRLMSRSTMKSAHWNVRIWNSRYRTVRMPMCPKWAPCFLHGCFDIVIRFVFNLIPFTVSASGKQKYYDIDVPDPDTLTSTSVDGSVVDSHQYRSERFDERFIGRNASLDGDNMSMHSMSTTRSDKYLPAASICTNASTSTATTTTTHIKRYKMERKNSQQSQHGKPEPSTTVDSKFNIQTEMSDIFNDIQVKIADLGNACYNVSSISVDLSKLQLMNILRLLRIPMTGSPFHRRYSDATVSFGWSVAGRTLQLHSRHMEHRLFGLWIIDRRLSVRSARFRWVFTRWRPFGAHYRTARQHTNGNYFPGKIWT